MYVILMYMYIHALNQNRVTTEEFDDRHLSRELVTVMVLAKRPRIPWVEPFGSAKDQGHLKPGILKPDNGARGTRRPLAALRDGRTELGSTQRQSVPLQRLSSGLHQPSLEN